MDAPDAAIIAFAFSLSSCNGSAAAVGFASPLSRSPLVVGSGAIIGEPSRVALGAETLGWKEVKL
jgi:hypothetical protein